MPRPFGLLEAFVRMIVLQICGGSLLLLWATGSSGRPPPRFTTATGQPILAGCGVRYTPGPGRGGRWRRSDPLERAPLAACVECSRSDRGLGWASGRNWRGRSGAHRGLRARPSPSCRRRGYGATREGFTTPEINPLARVLIGKLLLPAGSRLPGRLVSSSTWPSASSQRSSSCSTR